MSNSNLTTRADAFSSIVDTSRLQPTGEQEECQLTFACIFKRQAREPSWVLGEEFAKRRRAPTLPKPYSGGAMVSII
jgi:hypothetical protein